jgi:tetratricopeptide (TPR) repeat protein
VLMALSLALLLPAAPVTAAPPSSEEKTKARDHYQKGLTHYDIKEYSEALAEFKNAYRVVQDPAFLFNIAQCYRRLGQDVEALDYYRNYLRRFPTAPNRGEVERRIQEIERELAAKAPAAGAPPPAVESPASRPPPGPVTPLAPPPAPSAAPPVLPAPSPSPAATSAPSPAAVVTGSPAAASGGGEPAVYQRWWLWTGVGAVVAAAVVAAVAVATRGEVGDCLGISPCRTVGD